MCNSTVLWDSGVNGLLELFPNAQKSNQKQTGPLSGLLEPYLEVHLSAFYIISLVLVAYSFHPGKG